MKHLIILLLLVLIGGCATMDNETKVETEKIDNNKIIEENNEEISKLIEDNRKLVNDNNTLF